MDTVFIVLDYWDSYPNPGWYKRRCSEQKENILAINVEKNLKKKIHLHQNYDSRNSGKT